MTENLAGRGEGLAGLVAKWRDNCGVSRDTFRTEHNTESYEYHRGAYEAFDRVLGALEAAAPPSMPATGETSDGYHTFNELYEHRHALFSIICAKFGGWKANLHEDDTMFDGWFIAGVQTPLGQATYHLPLSWWDRFHCDARQHAPKWDGHTAADVPKRIAALATSAPWECKAKATADPPQDCGWPTCGCDPHADKVIEALQESGKL